jgi:hypothetical protein
MITFRNSVSVSFAEIIFLEFFPSAIFANDEKEKTIKRKTPAKMNMERRNMIVFLEMKFSENYLSTR